jgi:hypothetical protein
VQDVYPRMLGMPVQPVLKQQTERPWHQAQLAGLKPHGTTPPDGPSRLVATRAADESRLYLAELGQPGPWTGHCRDSSERCTCTSAAAIGRRTRKWDTSWGVGPTGSRRPPANTD